MSELKILIVDDDIAYRNLVVRIIKRSWPSLSCVCCPSGEHALEVIESGDFILFITDGTYSTDSTKVQSPRVVELFQDLYPGVPIACITGGSDHEEDLRRLGVTHFITKPFRAPTLISMIQELIKIAPLNSKE